MAETFFKDVSKSVEIQEELDVLEEFDMATTNVNTEKGQNLALRIEKKENCHPYNKNSVKHKQSTNLIKKSDIDRSGKNQSFEGVFFDISNVTINSKAIMT